MSPLQKRSRSPKVVIAKKDAQTKPPKALMTSLTLRSPTKPTSAANTPITKQPSIASFFSKASSTPSVPPFGQRNDETNVTTKPSSRNALTAPAKGTSFDSDSDDDIPVIKKRKVSQLNMSTIRTDLDRKSSSPSSAFAGTPKAGPNSLTVDTPSKQEEKPQATAAASSKRRLGQQGLWGREVVQIKKKGGGKVTGSANAGDSFEYNQGFHDYLPPISDIYDIFDDMTKNLEKNQRRIGTNMKEAFEHIGVRKLRVGTMCSGTESPVLALGMISKSLKKLFDIDFNIDHLFSAEIVPFKQAFIERNFAPPVIFRDIKEMLSSTIEATSAYGAMTPIPTDLDLLIAGFSCVDFSNLNNYKRKMEEVGESGDTLRAILAYAEKHRPRIIVLENVFGAPWDKIQEVWEKTVGYHCTWARFDTKDYYIPHTRQRGYMICIDKSQLPKGQRAMKDWQALVVAIQRPASSPIDTFTVDEDHPLMQRAREELARNLRADDKITKSSEWIKCLARHHDTRERLHLGIKRPYCKWVDGGSSFLPDWCWTDWGKAQTERVWDTLEISYLRNARRGFDMRYKTRVLQLSQNVDRDTDTQKFGITGCVTPTGIPFLTYRGRPVTGLESLVQQGLPLDEILITRESQSDLQDLAGNAMSTTVIGAAMLAAICVGFTAFPTGKSQPPSDRDAVDEVEKHIVDHTQLITRPLNLGSYQAVGIQPIIDLAERSSRRCLCEGRDTITSNKLQQCEDCGHSTCLQCGGNPEHKYKPLAKEFIACRIPPSSFEKQLKLCLPMRLRIGGITTDILIALKRKSKVDVPDKDWQIFEEGMEQALRFEFRYNSIRRAETWSVVFRSSSARLELDMNPLQPEWRVYAVPAKSLPGNSRARSLLNKVLARMRPKGKDLIVGEWELCLPAKYIFKLQVCGQGEQTKAWEARIGLLEPQFADKRVFSELSINVEEDDRTSLSADISGVYQHLPKCAAAEDSLHKRVGGKGDVPLFLFLDPHLYKPATQDCFIFSSDIRRPRYDRNTSDTECRQVLARMAPGYRFEASKSIQTLNCTTEGHWIPCRQIQITPCVSSTATMHSFPSPSFNFDVNECACTSARTLVACKVELSQQDNFDKDIGKWFEITRTNARTLFSQVSWMTERMRIIEGLSTWQELNAEDNSLKERCERCAPKSPRVRWRLLRNKLIPYEDPQDAGPFERALKNRPEAFVTQIHVNDHSIGHLRIGLNVLTLVHQALANLPHRVYGIDRKVSWRLHTEYYPPAHPTYPIFTLSNNKGTKPAGQPPNFNKKFSLRPEQLRSLGGMLENEADDVEPFVEEEVVEALLPQMGWRVEGRATTTVQCKGGVLADQVGYGKTATMLALIDSQFSAGKQKPDLSMKGKIHVKGTLLICPLTLVDQWETEVNKFLGDKRYRVLTLKTVKCIQTNTIASITEADIIICSWSLLTSESYLLRVAEFAGLPEIPASTGRSFNVWYGKALQNISVNVDVLRDNGASKLEKTLDHKYESLENDEEVTGFVPSKRLKGSAYRNLQEQMQQEAQKDGIKKQSARTALKDPASKPRLSDPFGLTSEAAQKNWKYVKSPLLQLFKFNRLVVDEFTYVKAENHTCISSMASTYRWVLSGTPPLSDFADVKSMAVFLGIHLGIDDDSLGAIKDRNIKLLRKDRTAGEAFRSFAQTLSPAWHDHRHAIAQRFLDQFVRRNIAEIDAFTVHDRVEAIALPAAERAIYNELHQILTAQDMRIRRGKAKSESDRERRVNELLGNSRSAEEALLKRCSHFTLADLNDQTGNNAPQACEVILQTRQAQFRDLIDDLKNKFKHAVFLKRQVGEADTHWSKLETSIESGGIWGDIEATNDLSLLIKEAYAGYAKTDEDMFYRDTDPEQEAEDKKEAEERVKTAKDAAAAAKKAATAAKRAKEAEKKRRAQEKKKAKEAAMKGKRRSTTKKPTTAKRPKTILDSDGSDDDTDDEFAHQSSDSDSDLSNSETTPDPTDNPTDEVYIEHARAPRLNTLPEKNLALRNLVLTTIRGLVREYVGRLRSLRYFQSIRLLQLAQTKDIGMGKSNCHKCAYEINLSQLSLVGSCGHIGCASCITGAIESGHGDTCIVSGCGCPALLSAANKATELGEEDLGTRTGKHYGVKLESLAKLILSVPADDQVLLFVQFEDLLSKCCAIFRDKGIKYYAISNKSGAKASQEMSDFQVHTGSRKKKVLILNLADETAAGANLTNANHVIFLSPLLTESQYKYEASMTQAIGRAVRYGQNKEVFIYRFLSLNTIDVEIAQERSKKALVEVKGEGWKLLEKEECQRLEGEGKLNRVHGVEGKVVSSKRAENGQDEGLMDVDVNMSEH